MRKFFIGVIVSAIFIACNNDKKTDAGSSTSSTTTSASDKKPASELLDISMGDMVKRSAEAFAKGDIDGRVANMADNVRVLWSSGDSLVGKQAAKDYFQKRWSIIDSATATEQIVLPIQVNEPQSKFTPAGKWILHWYLSSVKYKNGKRLTFWVHNANHLNDEGKIDVCAIYLDRYPIMEATKDLMRK